MTPYSKPCASRRVTLVADELLGYGRHGGLGTATSFLTLALARIGHQVEVLYVGAQPSTPVGGEWARLYPRADVALRMPPPVDEETEPPYFARIHQTELALAAEPPDVVIAQDLAAPCYIALRLRHLGLAFENTLFVAYCHGTRQWITDTARKVRVLPGALAVTTLERASIELADVLVSPSAYLVEWMRRQGWRLPARTLVIPYLSRSGATGEPPPAVRVDGDGRVERLAFFGRLEERKGLRPFAAGLNALDPRLLEGIELEFIGTPTTAWTPERVEALLSPTARRALRRISFASDLDQQEALARLSRPGTLAVMPSLADNSPNTVYECLERGIPFIASDKGGTPELIAPADHARVLFEPTPEGVQAALRRVLEGGDALQPARPAFDDADSLEAWAEVVAMPPPARRQMAGRPAVDVIVHHRGSREALSRCLSALARQSYRHFGLLVVAAGGTGPEGTIPDGLDQPLVVRCERASVEAAREAGLEAGRSGWVVFLDEEDVPEPELLDTLVRAQAASGADVVSCGLYLEEEEGGRALRFFAGQPWGLGLLENGYGTVALLRRSLLGGLTDGPPVEGDPDWPLLARLSASGAQIVSVPTPLLTRRARPGTLERHPSDALLVVAQFERALPDQLKSLVRLAAGLAANAHKPPVASPNGVVRRAVRVVRAEGLSGLSRRAGQRAFRPFFGWHRG
jgi:glycosyltransferase involved in cell wall biosynthesis